MLDQLAPFTPALDVPDLGFGARLSGLQDLIVAAVRDAYWLGVRDGLLYATVAFLLLLRFRDRRESRPHA